MARLKPINDFIFKKLFGEKGDEPMLISFLNAVLQKTHKEKITTITIQDNKELTQELINDKTGRIDVRATTSQGEEIDIEVQVTNQNNMDKRTLFYWSKLYLEGIKKGDDYRKLSKVITINLLEAYFIKQKAHSIRIDVVYAYPNNVLGFWDKLGFVKQDEIELNWNNLKSKAYVMSKLLQE